MCMCACMSGERRGGDGGSLVLLLNGSLYQEQGDPRGGVGEERTWVHLPE